MRTLVGAGLVGVATAQGNPACWSGDINWSSCCAPEHGTVGNQICWDDHFTFDSCCGGPEQDQIPLESDTYTSCGPDQVCIAIPEGEEPVGKK